MGARRAVPYVPMHPKAGHMNYRKRIPTSLRAFGPGRLGEFVWTIGAHDTAAPGAFDRLKAAQHEYDVMIAKAR